MSRIEVPNAAETSGGTGTAGVVTVIWLSVKTSASRKNVAGNVEALSAMMAVSMPDEGLLQTGFIGSCQPKSERLPSRRASKSAIFCLMDAKSSAVGLGVISE
jgi:hypothetical protein